MHNTIFWIILAIVFADFLFGVWLQALSSRASRKPIPKILDGIYDSEKYAKQQSYFRINHQMEFVKSSVKTFITLSFFAFGGLAWLDSIARGFSPKPVLAALCFFSVLYVIDFLADLPFIIIDTFEVEQRYGFNKTSPKTFVGDTIKSFLLNALLLGGLLALCVWVYTLTPRWFWLIAWGIYAAFTLLLQYFYSQIIVPLFNKQKPLEEGELRTAIELFAKETGFELENIYVMDASKRSTKANAYFTGYGKKKRIVLFDTLIDLLTPDEIVGVLAHEIGHYKHGHLIKDITSSLITSLITLWVFSLVIENTAIAAAAGCPEPSFWVNLAVFSLLMEPLGVLLGIVSNAISRKHEHQADAYAKEHSVGQAESSGLKKICAQGLMNLTPHPLVVFVEYSHPALDKRVEFLERI